MVKRLLAPVGAVLLCFAVAGCALLQKPDGAEIGQNSPAPVETPAQGQALVAATPLPMPTAEPAPDYDKVAALGTETFNRLFQPHLEVYDHKSSGMLDMPGLMAKQGIYDEMCARTVAALRLAARQAHDKMEAELESGGDFELKLENPLDWRLMAALCAATYNPEPLIKANTRFDITIDESGKINMCAALPDFDKVLQGSPTAVWFRALMLFSYLNTAYDDNGEIRENDGAYELSDEYIATIMDPLPNRRIKDGWYGDRSHATRRHTGTDIRASEGTEIPSCTSGTVIRIGYDDISGNFVAVKDESGFIYFYCHMVELTTFLAEGDSVEQGRLIGHVGNTGNSDAPHLHLGIIAPEKCYINPFPVLHRVRYGR